MRKLSKNYEYIILDFSVMFTDLDEDATELLNRTECVVAPTFDCECRHMKEIVPCKNQRRFLENRNKPFLKNLKCMKEYGVLDTFGLASYLAGKGAEVLVVSANYLLEDEIVFSGQAIDIYSLMEERVIKNEDFIFEIKDRAIDTKKTPLQYVEISQGATVYTDKGAIVLEKQMGHGAEAAVYKVQNQNKLLAKVFKKDEDGMFVLTAQKLENIRMLKEVGKCWDVSWLSLPVDIIYADEKHLYPVGYLMKHFENMKFMSDDAMFCGDIALAMKENKRAEVKDVLELCMKMVRQVLFLGMNDIYITDYNDKNFGIQDKNGRAIVLIDTDSYCSDHYVGDSLTYLYLDSMSRPYDKNKKEDLIQICNESAHAFTFGRLALDGTFLPMRKGKFRYGASKHGNITNPLNQLKWDSIPANLQKLYTDIYEKKHPASLSVLLYELERASESFFANIKYADIYKDVLKVGEENMKEDNVTVAQTVFEPESQSIMMPTSPVPGKTVSAVGGAKESQIWIWIVMGIVGWIVSLFVVILVLADHMGHKNKELENVLVEQILEIEQQLAESQEMSSSSDKILFEEEYIPSDVPLFEEEYVPNDESLFEEEYVPNDESLFEEYIPSDEPLFEEESTADENFTGYGSLYTDAGELIYEGDFVDGKFSGEGIYYFDGVGFACTWQAGNAHDIGLYINDDEYGNGSWIDNNFYGVLFEDNEWKSVEIIDGEKFYRGDYTYYLD